jgi:DNA-binding transcriptional regulator YiaG
MKVKARRRRPARTNAAGRRLMAALDAIEARNVTVRHVEISDPAPYGPAQVRALRGELGVSTAVFARLVGVTPGQVEHWEQGRREPSPLARRLLDRIAADPAGYFAALVRHRPAG